MREQLFSNVYTKAATARLLQIATRIIKQVRYFWNAVWVWVAGQRPTFISKRRYTQEFVNSRKRTAATLRILGQRRSHFGTIYSAESSQPGNAPYQVEVCSDRISCTCEDWANQAERWGNAACKHVYRVLDHLGYSRLSDYLMMAALR